MHMDYEIGIFHVDYGRCHDIPCIPERAVINHMLGMQFTQLRHKWHGYVSSLSACVSDVLL